MPKPAVPMFISDLRIPKARSGDFQISHRIHQAGEPITRVNIKESILGGAGKPEKWIYDVPIKIHVLEQLDTKGGQNGVWMSDSPAETRLHEHIIDTCEGDILVAGLGLGYTPTELSKKSTVTSIDIVELNQDVINLVWRHVRTPKMNLVTGDFFEYLATCKKRYNWLYFDILPDYNEDLLYTHILPLFHFLRLNPIVLPDNVLIWAYDTIIGQLSFDLMMDLRGDSVSSFNRLSMFCRLRKDPKFIENLAFCRTKFPFYKWFAEHPDLRGDALRTEIEFYVDRFGLPDWVDKYGKYLDFAEMEKVRERIYAD